MINFEIRDSDFFIMGRRIEKKVYFNNNLIRHIRFVYDGYLQIEELDALNNNAVVKQRIWSGGKIICEIHGSDRYYALTDANKNITEYIDSSGNISAHYEYSPFGKITVSTGTILSDFDFRFSSEYFDPETKLVYYNYRYYSLELGRWLSRDPIGELRLSDSVTGEREVNPLYVCNHNNSINKWDYLGLEWTIRRDGKPRALVCSNDIKDTFHELAERIGLDIAELKKWLRDKDGNPVRLSAPRTNIVYSIPNTLFVTLIRVATYAVLDHFSET